MSSGPLVGSMATATVRARSWAEMPVVTPSRASIETVKAVPCSARFSAGHRRQAQLPGALGGDRQADQAARVLGHEVDLLGRGQLGRDDDVALVLAVLGVDEDVGPALAGVLDDVLDRRDRVVVGAVVGRYGSRLSHSTGRHSAPACRSRGSPGRPAINSPKGGHLQVCGMMFTPKMSSSTSLTVSDTPSTVIEPFGAMKRCSGAGRADGDPVRAALVVDRDHLPHPVDVARDDVAAQLVAQRARRAPG